MQDYEFKNKCRYLPAIFVTLCTIIGYQLLDRTDRQLWLMIAQRCVFSYSGQ